MIRIATLMTSALALTACAHLQTPSERGPIEPDAAGFVEAIYLPDATVANATPVERIIAVPMPGQLKPMEDRGIGNR